MDVYGRPHGCLGTRAPFTQALPIKLHASVLLMDFISRGGFFAKVDLTGATSERPWVAGVSPPSKGAQWMGIGDRQTLRARLNLVVK
jgi:hypothetical protein